jgi:hypothetical protein
VARVFAVHAIMTCSCAKTHVGGLGVVPFTSPSLGGFKGFTP